MQAPWSIFKNFISQRNLSIQWIDLDTQYWMKAFDGPFELECTVIKDSGDDQTDFETNYKDSGNQSPVSSVRTQFEQVAYLLQMSNMQANNVAPSASAVVTIQIPGTFNGVNPPCNGRYIDEGEAWFYPGVDGDTVTSITITDNDNLLGIGAGAIIGTYSDSQVPSANQGWALHPVFPTEVSTLGWYGFIPSGMYLNITVQRSTNATVNGNFYCNLKWGMRTS
jgi:hypothetical protein